jgi:ParB family chromosome partitioning protein
MADWWEPDTALFSLLHDREVLTHMVADVAGEQVAQANAAEKTATLKTIIRAHLDGAEGRTKIERWVPRWMRFEPGAYTERGGVGTVRAARKVAAASEALVAVDNVGDGNEDQRENTGDTDVAPRGQRAQGGEPLAA